MNHQLINDLAAMFIQYKSSFSLKTEMINIKYLNIVTILKTNNTLTNVK